MPAHWQVLPARAIFTEVDVRGFSGELLLSVTIDKGVVPQRALLRDSSHKDSSRLDKSAYKLVLPGDITYNKMRAWQGALGVSEYRGIVSPAYVVQRPRRGNDSRYFHNLLRTPRFTKEAQRWSYGIVSDMWSLRPEHFKKIRCCLPPLCEQKVIVRYLEYLEQRIRRYVRAKERLIGLLEEEKQAIINQAVTRGLDPSVRLKASGVEWLGDVPEHWEVKKVTQLFSIGSGTTPPTSARHYYGGDICWITTSELRESTIQSTKQTITRQALREFSSLRVYPSGSVAVAMYGATIGRIGVLGVPAAVNQACCVFFESNEIITEFWFYWLQSRRPHLMALGHGGGQPNLSQQLLRSIRVPVPTRSEQIEIAQFLDRSVSDISGSIKRARRQIELVEEYRTRLIADVVTGKLDVREAAAGLGDEEGVSGEK